MSLLTAFNLREQVEQLIYTLVRNSQRPIGGIIFENFSSRSGIR